MLNIRTISMSIILALVLLFAVQLVTARTEVVSNPSSDLASVLDNREQSANQNKSPIASYRSRLGECFDVPLREAAACQATSQASGIFYQLPLDECFDVSISEVTRCREASQVLNP